MFWVIVLSLASTGGGKRPGYLHVLLGILPRLWRELTLLDPGRLVLLLLLLLLGEKGLG